MTIIQRFASADFGDPTLRVLSNDVRRVCTVGDDFIFDAGNPACYAGGVLPDDGDPIPSGGLVNLARDVAPAFGRSANAVTAVPTNGAQLPTFDSGGLTFQNAAKAPLQVQKVGVSNSRVCEPTLEGYRSFLLLVWLRVLTMPSSGAYGVTGSGQGGASPTGIIAITSGGAIAAYPPTGGGISMGTFSVGPLYCLALGATFDGGAGTSEMKTYKDGALVQTAAGPAPSSWPASNGSARMWIGGAVGFSNPHIRIYRERRVHQTVAGVAALDILDNEESACRTEPSWG